MTKKNSIGTKDTNLSLLFGFGNVVNGQKIRTSKPVIGVVLIT